MADVIGPKTTKSGQHKLDEVPCPACASSPTEPCLFCMGKRAVPLTRAIEFSTTRDTDPAPPLDDDDQKSPK